MSTLNVMLYDRVCSRIKYTAGYCMAIQIVTFWKQNQDPVEYLNCSCTSQSAVEASKSERIL